MHVLVDDISEILTSSSVRLALVQLRSPFSRGEMIEARYPDQIYTWSDKEYIEKRLTKIGQTLNILAALDPLPTLIVFPEYSVPVAAHDIFQDHANQHRCIIIGGTYFQQYRDLPLFRNNICTIYLPNRPKIQITKRYAYGGESDVLSPDLDVPNIARFRWKIADAEWRSVSIYICRDYLIPYADDSSPASNPATARRSTLDWDNEGLNIVTMHSPDTTLFESQAAFDVRRMRGPGKIVALCNCSETKSAVGTAILGPAQSRSVRDIVQSLPPETEGILISDLDLTTVAYVERRPDRQTLNPVRSIAGYLIDQIDDDSPVTLTLISNSQAAKERGVWHPAFLDVLGREMHINFYVSRHLMAVRDLFRKERIRNVYAASVRGEYDLVIRRYGSNFESRDYLAEPVSRLPYSSLGSRFDDLLDQFRTMKMTIQPRDMLKTRTIRVDTADWDSRRRLIERVLPRNENARKEMLHACTQLAMDWDDSEITDETRTQLSPIFYTEKEATVVIGPTDGSPFRESYILIAPLSNYPDTIDKLESQCIRGFLMDVSEVRSIFRVQVRGPVAFQYFLHVIADPWTTDKIVMDIRTWAERERAIIGTRTIDVQERYKSELVRGLASTDLSQEILQFLSAFQEREGDIADLITPELIRKSYRVLQAIAGIWADLVSRADEDFEEIGTEDVARDIIEDISRFYCALYGRQIAPPAQQSEYQRKAIDSWTNMYRKVEETCELILQLHIGAAEEELAETLKSQLAEKVGPEAWVHLRSDLILLLLRVYREDRNRAELARSAAGIRATYDLVRPFRNRMVHGNRSQQTLDLVGPDWRTKLETIERATEGLVRILARVIGWRLTY